jgi:rhodanese-related sulfurtransferase
METMRGLRYLILAGIVLLTPGLARSSENSAWQWIDSARLQNMLREGSSLWLIDIRDQYSFASGHIEGAINMPVETLKARSFPQSKMLVICDDYLGLRLARETGEALAARGNTKIYLLDGGITRWKRDGYPYVEITTEVKGVTASELTWAIGEKVALKIYDLRDEAEKEKGRIETAEAVSGKSIDERITGLNNIMKSRTSEDLSGKMTNRKTIVLVFSAADDVLAHLRQIRFLAQDDMRYLIGGYESFKGSGTKFARTLDTCPTCFGK